MQKKELKNHEEDIHRCSKCGLCQSVCPVYKVTGNDCAVSRGKFIMLNGIIKGDLTLNKNVNKYLDMCLKCNACKDFCPSGIDAREIFLSAKSEYFQNCFMNKFVSFAQSKYIFAAILTAVKIAATTYRTLNFDKLLHNFYPILSKFKLGKKAILANEFLTTSNQLLSSSSTINNSAKVVYFKGCVNEYITPRAKDATENILKKMGAEILPANFECCGVPFLSVGNVEQFERQAIFNLSQIPDDFDYFLTDCASCQDAFVEYKKVIDDEKLLMKLDKVLEKSMNVSEFIVKNVEKIEFKEKVSFTFHKPCHLEKTDFIKEFLAKSKNVEYVEMKDYDKCCGFAGGFALLNPLISEEISKEKAQNAVDTNADYILTTCPSCTLGLIQGLIESKEYKKLPKVMNFIEFINL